MESPSPLFADASTAVYSDRASVTLFRRRRPLFWLALAFCCGNFLDHLFEPRLPLLGGMMLSALAFVVLLLVTGARIRRSNSRDYWASLSGLTLALAGGMLIHGLGARIPASDDIARRTPASSAFVCLEGVIIDASHEQGSDKPVWTVAVATLGPEFSALTPASGRARIRLNAQAPAYGEGDRVQILARLEAPPEVSVPGAFDSAAFLEAQGIRRSGAATIAGVHRVSSPSWLRPDLMLRRFSSRLSEQLAQALPSNSSAGDTNVESEGSSQSALLSALLLGRRDRVDASDREAFSINGAAHLLAIAGWHLQFLTFLFWRALGFTGLSRRRSAWLVIGAVCAYCALTGAATPVLRATIMIVLYLLAPALSREADPLSALAAAALLILCAAPAELFSAGFQLSFLAVLALATIYPALDDAWTAWRQQTQRFTLQAPGWRERLSSWIRPLLLVSFVAWLGTAPAVAWHMGRLSLLSLIVNLIAVPLGGACMIAGLATLFAGAITTGFASLIGKLAFVCVWALQNLNQLFAKLPFAALDLPPPAIPVLIVYAAALLWLWVERRRAATLGRALVLTPMCLLLLSLGVFFRESAPAPRVTVLDLKLGRAALIESTDGGAALIDSGGPGQGARIAETLRREGIARLALLVISADESDALGGAVSLIERVPVARVILPRGGGASGQRRELERALTLRGIPYDWPDAKQALRGPGEVVWEFLDDSPAGQPVPSETCLAVRLSMPGTRMLFVAARSNPEIKRLLANDADGRLNCDILRISNVNGAHWPTDLPALFKSAHCRAIVAGQSSAPGEIAGFDIGAWSNAHDIRVLSPHQQGSLRIQADTGGHEQQVQAYRAGVWRAVE